MRIVRIAGMESGEHCFRLMNAYIYIKDVDAFVIGAEDYAMVKREALEALDRWRCLRQSAGPSYRGIPIEIES